MQINWFGYGAFKIQENNVNVIFDPVVSGSNFKLRKGSADILLLSHKRTKDDLACVPDEAFVIDSPGEYEIKGVFITGIAYNSNSTMYLLTIDNTSIVWLGPVQNKYLANGMLEKIKDPDILMIPVGGGEVLSAKEASGIINQLEPRLVIPAYYQIKGSKGLEPVDKFLKEYGAPKETLDKLKISHKDLLSEDTRVVVITV